MLLQGAGDRVGASRCRQGGVQDSFTTAATWSAVYQLAEQSRVRTYAPKTQTLDAGRVSAGASKASARERGLTMVMSSFTHSLGLPVAVAVLSMDAK